MTRLAAAALVLGLLASAAPAAAGDCDDHRSWWGGIFGDRDNDCRRNLTDPGHVDRENRRNENEWIRDHPERFDSMSPADKERIRQERAGETNQPSSR